MAKRTSLSAPALCGVIVIASWLLVRQAPLLAKPAGRPVRKIAFDAKDALAGWTIAGEVAVAPAKGRGGKGGALRIPPGGKAVLTLRDRGESGKVVVWVHDDGTTPRATAGPGRRSSSPATRGSTPPPARAGRADRAGGPTSTCPPRSGRRARSPASRTADVRASRAGRPSRGRRP